MPRPAVLLAAVLALVAATPAAAGAAPPPIKHVWVIVLENTSYAESFGPTSKAPYFSRDLPAQGALLTQYFGTTHFSLGNYIAMLSGQPPNVQTQSDCLNYTDFAGGVDVGDGVVAGQGCVYPASVRTLADQLRAKGLANRAYLQDMANGPGADTCRHPALNGPDDTQTAEVGDQYATRHNPAMYFHSQTDDQARCSRENVDLGRLDADLAAEASTPAFSFVTPNLCDDGHDEPTCVDGRPGGLVAADAFLQRTVPKIIASPAFQRDGLILVTFDEAEATGPGADSSACCNEPAGPNTANPGGPTPGPGGGRIGAVALSRFITPGTTSTVPYNHYSFLRSMEGTFGIGEHLGYANQMGLATFGADVYNNPAGTTKLPLAGMTPPGQRSGSASPGTMPAGKPGAAGPSDTTTCNTTRVRSRRIRRGDLIRSIVVSDPIGGRRVQVSIGHTARLTITQTTRGRTRTVVRGRLVSPCRQYRFRLPGAGAGQLAVTASLPRGSERRSVRHR